MLFFALKGGVLVSGIPGGEDVTITIDSANIASDLTDFPTKIDLRDMPASFWADVDDGGGNVRVYDSSGIALIPHDVVACVLADQTGILFVKSTLLAATDTELVVKLETTGTGALVSGDPNGRDAVWSDYEIAVIGPSKTNRTGGVALSQSGNVSAEPWKETARGADVNVHQGICFYGAHYYAVDTDELIKYDTIWTEVARNSTPVADVKTSTGVTTLDHCGDGAVIGGELWVPVEEYPNAPYDTQFLAVFNIADLTLNRVIDISAAGRECSSVCEGPGGNLYVSDFTNGASIPYFNTSGVLQGTMSLSSSIDRIQGITYMNGKFYISSGLDDSIYEVDTDGTVIRVVYKSYYTGDFEGLDNDGTSLYALNDDVASFSGIRIITPATGKEEWFRIHSGWLYATVTGSPVWAMSTTWQPTPDLVQGGLMSLTSGSNRATLVGDNSPLRLTAWNNSNSWMATGAVKPVVYTDVHVVHGHNGTAERKVWANGAQNAIDPGVTAKHTGGSMDFIFGASTTGGSEKAYGHFAQALLRLEYPPDDWVAFEALNHKTPSGSYAIS